MIKKTFKVILGIIVTSGLLFGLYLLVLTVTDLNHEPIETLAIEQKNDLKLDESAEFTVTTFNIGYAGLDAKQDFFMDGGTKSRSSSLEQTQINHDASTSFLTATASDFIFLQEVDLKASRSFKINEYEHIKKALPQYEAVFANNYHAQWVPAPLLNPMGFVDGGMATFSKYTLSSANRHQFEGKVSWPMKLMELDRCFIESEIKLSSGKSLYLINLHLSAYDKGGTLRNKQMQHLTSYMNEKYEAGHYVVLGGDWNHLLSSVQESDPEFIAKWPEWLVKIPSEFEAGGFKWGVDHEAMTVRDLNEAYVEGQTFTTIIDGFLVSPNVEIISVATSDLNFQNSDHNPVTLKFKLMP